MKNLIVSLLVGLVLLCAFGVAFVLGLFGPVGGEALQPDKTGAADTAVVSDENQTTKHQVMKPVVPSNDDKQNGEELETTKPDSNEPGTNPNDKN